MLLVQKYLRSGKTLDDLKQDHGVKSTITNGKISLNYDQIESSNSDPLASQCRGLILKEGSYDVVACGMFRFFNLEQTGVAAEIDWKSARFLEKLDGTCIFGYFFEDKWYVATRGRSEADVPLEDDSDLTFSKLTDHACDQMWRQFNKRIPDRTMGVADLMQAIANNHPDINIKDKTFVFELTSPYNRIVCKYEDVKLTLLAVRDITTLQEEDPKNWIGEKEFGLEVPKEYFFNNIEDMVRIIREWDPKDHEGVVVRDANWNRIKVKNPAYIAYNHARDSLATSVRGCVEVILLGKDDDIIDMMPELIGNRIKSLKPLIKEIFVITQKDYDELKHIEDMKTFALEAQKRLWPAALFALKRGKTPDLKTFSLGNHNDVSKIPSTASDMMLALCKKINPDICKVG